MLLPASGSLHMPLPRPRTYFLSLPHQLLLISENSDQWHLLGNVSWPLLVLLCCTLWGGASPQRWPRWPHLLTFLHFVVLSLWICSVALWFTCWLMECGRSNTVQFLRWVYQDPCCFYLGLLEYLLFRHDSLSETSHQAVRSPSHLERPWVGALVKRPSGKPAPNNSHVNKPHWTSSPVEPPSDFPSSCHLTAVVWLSPSQNCLAEPSQSTEPWETKINVCGKPSRLGIVCYTEIDHWNTLRALYFL